jgi:hypothetical protein
MNDHKTQLTASTRDPMLSGHTLKLLIEHFGEDIEVGTTNEGEATIQIWVSDPDDIKTWSHEWYAWLSKRKIQFAEEVSKVTGFQWKG